MSENTEEVQAVEIMAVDSRLLEVAKTFSLTKAESHAMAFNGNMQSLTELSKDLKLMDKENPTDADSKVAYIKRNAIVKVRTGAAEIKKKLKEDLLTEGKLIDSLNGVIENACKLTESEYAAIEKFAENKRISEEKELYNERFELISKHASNASIYPLGTMEQSSFDDLLNGMKLANEAKLKAEKESEESRIAKEKQDEADRIAKEKADADARESQRMDNERLKAEVDKKEKELAEERRTAKEKQDAIESKAKADKERADKIIANQKKEADDKLKAEQNKARVAKAETDKKEVELKRQLQEKQDAEDKAEAERVAELKAEEKRKKDLLKAGDKARIKAWVETFNIESIETKGMSEESVIKANGIYNKFQAYTKWSLEQAESI